MLKWCLLAVVRTVVMLIGLILSPVMPYFAKMKEGKINNDNGIGIEPRLPFWLNWFQTPDNSLWGDEGWQTKHRKDDYKTIAGMGAWIRRNTVYGISWGLLGAKIDEKTTFKVEDSGKGLDVDKDVEKKDWFYIKASNGAFQYRLAKRLTKTYTFNLDIGWLLDVYVKEPGKWKTHPKALFRMSIRFKNA